VSVLLHRRAFVVIVKVTVPPVAEAAKITLKNSLEARSAKVIT
jgi:hypothetical protein